MQHKFHYTFILLHFRPHHTIFNKQRTFFIGHFTAGLGTSWRDAYCNCYAHHVNLIPTTTWPYGYTGLVINLPQDVMSFANRLPRLPSNLSCMVVRKEGVDQSHRDFHVRRSVVHRALQWLIMNNIYSYTLMKMLLLSFHMTETFQISLLYSSRDSSNKWPDVSRVVLV